MPTATYAEVQKRVIAILMANRSAYATTVSGDTGAFPTDTEITEIILEADEMVVTQGYFPSVNASLRENFLVVTNLTSGDPVTFHYGTKYSNVDLSLNGSTFYEGIEVKNPDIIVNAIQSESYVESGAFDRLFTITRGRIYSTAPFINFWYPFYQRSVSPSLYANQSETFLVVATAIRLASRNASPAPFEVYTQESINGIQQLVTNGEYTESKEM